MAQFEFNTESVQRREASYELLPAGWYAAQVTESEIVSLKSGNGQALKITLEVLTDGYRGRKLWARLNVRHSNPEAERIAQQQLRELCESVGLARFRDTTELHNKPVQVKVKIRKDETGQYEDQNEVSGFKPAAGGAAPMAAASPRPAAPAANAPAAGAAVPPVAEARRLILNPGGFGPSHLENHEPVHHPQHQAQRRRGAACAQCAV